MKIKRNKLIIRKDIDREPTVQEREAIRQWGQDTKNKCIDCGKPLYYFNQCDDCYAKMIAVAKIG